MNLSINLGLIMRLALCILFSAICAPLCAESVRIATYNVRNYLVMDRHVGSKWRPVYPKPESEKTSIREVIKSARPDILVLQEMGSLDFLEELRADLNVEGLHYPYAVHMRGPDYNRHIAILSMLPPEEVVKFKHIDFKYLDRREKVKRGMVEVSFMGPQQERFTLFAVHLKSRYTEDKADPESELRRVKEAEACRNVIISRTLEKNQDKFMILGDFNAYPGSAPMRRFYKRGKLKIGNRLPAHDSNGEQWTYFYNRESSYHTVDGFVLSAGMAPHVKAGNAKIVDSGDVMTGSDHRMVYADFIFENPNGDQREGR
ncbi:MAG: endonuclease/exonuclease/phosphatase family protein [Opitutaceae bacterium]